MMYMDGEYIKIWMKSVIYAEKRGYIYRDSDYDDCFFVIFLSSFLKYRENPLNYATTPYFHILPIHYSLSFNHSTLQKR
jgi:hypothetical protein